VNELEEAEIDGQLLLRDTAMRPGSQERPEALGGCSEGTLDFNFFVENGLAEFLKLSQWLRTTYEAPY